MNGYVPQKVTLPDLVAAIAQNTTRVVSKVFPITRFGALNCTAAVKLSAYTAGSGVTFKLQGSPDGGTTWVDVKSATISGTGFTYLYLNCENSTDQAYMPLLPLARLEVITAGGGAAATVDDCYFYQGS
jgi:hypothetical protein